MMRGWALVAIVVGVGVAGLLVTALRRRQRVKEPDWGSVSTSWIAEHQAGPTSER